MSPPLSTHPLPPALQQSPALCKFFSTGIPQEVPFWIFTMDNTWCWTTLYIQPHFILMNSPKSRYCNSNFSKEGSEGLRGWGFSQITEGAFKSWLAWWKAELFCFSGQKAGSYLPSSEQAMPFLRTWQLCPSAPLPAWWAMPGLDAEDSWRRQTWNPDQLSLLAPCCDLGSPNQTDSGRGQ